MRPHHDARRPAGRAVLEGVANQVKHNRAQRLGRKPHLRALIGLNQQLGAGGVEAIGQIQAHAFYQGGYLYLLTPGILYRYDAVLGVKQGSWRPENLGVRLNDARALVRVFAPN